MASDQTQGQVGLFHLWRMSAPSAMMRDMKVIGACISLLLLTSCSSAPAATVQAPPTQAPLVDPVVTAITERYGACLTKLKFTQPFDITVYQSTHKADVSGASGVLAFRTATSNSGSLLIIPEDSDSSARLLASVGCA